GVEGRNEPLTGANACDGIEQCQLPILRAGKARTRRRDIVGMTSGPATARLDHFDMEEQSLEGVAEKQRPFELGGAPWHCEIMAEEHTSLAVDDGMSKLEGIRAAEPRQVVDLGIFIEVCWERAEFWAAGVVDHEIARHRRERIAVARPRDLASEAIGKLWG